MDSAATRMRRIGVVVLVAVVYAAVVATLLRASLFEGKVLTQADALLSFQPWKSVAPAGFRPGNELLLDQATGFLPWNDFIAEELARGELPLWCPYNYAGIPLVGTYQSAIYWPLNWIYFAAPDWGSYAWMALIRLVAAGVFAFLFLRRLGLAGGAAAVGGLGYMLCGFMVAWLNHPHANVALFLPAFLLLIERMAVRPGWRDAAWFGLLFGLQLLGGHAQTSLHVGLFTACYALWRCAVPLGGQRLAFRGGLLRLGAGALLGLVLAAPQIVPFLDYLGHSQAAAVFDRDDLVASDGVTDAALMMVAPSHFGAPHTHDYTGPLGPNLNYNELIGGYVGRLMLLFAALQIAWLGWVSKYRNVCLFFALTVGIAGLVAWQVEPVYGLFRAVPGLSSTKLMRFLLFVAFGLSVLGAMGLDGMLRRIERARTRSAITIGAFAIVATELVLFAQGYNPEVDRSLLLPRTQVTDFLQKDRFAHRVLAVDNTALKPNANVFLRIPMLSGYDSMEDRSLTELLLRGTLERPKYPFVSQIGAWNRIDAFPMFCLLGVKYVLTDGPLPPPFRKVLDAEMQVYENPMVRPKAFFARELRAIDDPAERIDVISSSSFDPLVAIVTSESAALKDLRDDPDGARGTWSAELGTSPVDAEDVTVVRYEPREIEVRVASKRRAMLVVADQWDAGWHAEVRGTAGVRSVPIERVDHALRGIAVEPGAWTVVLRYDPLGTRIAIPAALVALLALIVLLVRGRWRARSEPQA